LNLPSPFSPIRISGCLSLSGSYRACIPAFPLGAYPQADLDNAEYVIMAGANRAEAIVTPDTMDLFKRTKGRGAKLICVDPRFTNTAAKADKWLAINPGTDLAFVLALTYVVLNEELYNKEYVEAHFNGFEEYKSHVLSPT